MNPEFRIIFRGEIAEGQDRKTVEPKLLQLLGLDSAKADAVFSGRSLVLKTTSSREQAEKIVAHVARTGAVAHIETKQMPEVSTPETLVASPPETNVNPTSVATERPKEPLPQPAKQTSLFKERLQYQLDTFMAKGSSSSFKALLVVFLGFFAVIAFARALIRWLSPETLQQYTDLGVLGNIYVTFLQLTDPGNMAQDILSSGWYKFFAILAGIAGVILLSALIAVITTALDQKLAELKRGRSKTLEQGHTLIIGWDEERVVEILRELIWANESEDDACVVILAEQDKQLMDEILRMRLPKTASTRIVTRAGSGTLLSNLERVNLSTAKSVIILAACADTASYESKIRSDAMSIQTLLAVTTQGIPKEDYAVVAEVFNETYRDIISTTFPDYVVTLDSSDILAKLMVQTSRSVGLSVVYSELLSFDGCELYFHGTDWKNTPFGQLAYHFEDGVPIGVRGADGKLSINPAANYEMRPGDEILIVADDDSTIEFQPQPIYSFQEFPLSHRRLHQIAECELIIGWNHKARGVISEFSDYVAAGSVIDVVIHNATDIERLEVEALDAELPNIKINLIDINPLDRNQLMELQLERYGTVIVLASARLHTDTKTIDSENIVTLLLLRNIFSEMDKLRETKLITEVLESQNHALIAQAGVKDMIISSRLVSMITAQISESPGIKLVYDDIFEEDGSEIYLKPASLYFDEIPESVSFADLIAIAQKRREACFGVKVKALEGDQSQNNGVILIPPKDKIFQLCNEDCLVVVAEDEL